MMRDQSNAAAIFTMSFKKISRLDAYSPLFHSIGTCFPDLKVSIKFCDMFP
jgi:hypothetical protein